MKAHRKTLLSNVRQWGAQSFRVNAVRDHTKETQPLRAELFSADQMERHGRTLADTHQLTRNRCRTSFSTAFPTTKLYWWNAPAC